VPRHPSAGSLGQRDCLAAARDFAFFCFLCVIIYWLTMYYMYMLQVSDNGVVSIGRPFNSFTPEELPLNETMIIAPYWADTDVSGTGRVFYRETTDPSLLDRATSEIRAAFSVNEYFSVTNLLIITWDGVGYYYRSSDKVMISSIYFSIFIIDPELLNMLLCSS